MADKTKMNKKIASEIAVGITLLVAIVIGVIFLVQDMRQGLVDNSEKIAAAQPAKIAVEKPAASPIETALAGNEQKENQQQDLTDESKKEECRGHLYEGEAMIKGTYSLTTIPGTAKKDWLFKVVKDDIEKLPLQARNENSNIANDLLYISDASPEVAAKLKKATETKPETITIKGFYLDCEGVPVVSIEPARLALAKYLKK